MSKKELEMDLEAKEVCIKKEICFLRAFFCHLRVLLIQEQVVSLFEETVKKESNAFSDSLLSKRQDNLAADRSDIEVLSVF